VSVEAVVAGQCRIAETGLGLAVDEAGAESSLQACLRVSIVTSIETTIPTVKSRTREAGGGMIRDEEIGGIT
jgi:hypothetical protein